MRPPKQKPPAAFRRDPPDLPSQFDPLAPPSSDELLAEVNLVQSLDLRSANLRTFRAEGSRFEHVILSSAQISTLTLRDTSLANCDFANALAHRLTCVRVEFRACRLTGLRCSAIEFRDVLFEDCDLDYAQFPNALFHACEFRNSSLREADLQGASLSGCLIHSSNLARADLRGASLQAADLRTSVIDAISIHRDDLQGAIVDPIQAVSLARFLGLDVR
jgi:uncharacterized protein YjbI with pentapeptide repeats